MTITSNTTAPELTFAKSGVYGILRHLSPSRLIRINAAYRSFRAFRALDDERLADLGITRADVEKTRFADFLTTPRR